MKKQLTALLIGTFLTSTVGAEILKKVVIDGTRRIDNELVMNYLNLNEGDDITKADLDKVTKNLFSKGLFSDIDVKMNDGVININVTENPIVHSVYFEGNKKLNDDILKTEVSLKPLMTYTTRKLQDDAARLVNVYKRNGRFGAVVTPEIIEKDQNRVDVIFKIDEGPKTYVKKINIVGGDSFPVSTLKEKMLTQEKAWYRFLSSTDTYDPDRLNYDQELLRRFYMQQGYVDFKVNNAAAELTPDMSGFVISLNISEGNRYRFGNVDVAVSLPEYEKSDKLKKSLEIKSGEIFNIDRVEKIVDALTQEIENEGFAFVEVTPEFQKNEEKKIVDIVFRVSEGKKVYINEIKIQGNSRTKNNVILREFRIKNEDAFNAAKLRRSKQRVEDLDYFSRVDMQTVPTDQPDRVDVVMDVEEKSTGAFSVGFGWSSYDGLMFETGIQERNILGTGNIVSLNAMLSQKETQYAVGLTNPYFLGRNLLAGVDVFHTTRDNSDSSSYSYDTTGATLRLGWDYTEHFRQSARYTLREDDVNDIDSDASIYIQEQKGRTVVSMIGQELVYDKRDSRINPTTGYYTSIGTDFAGLGGDSKYFRVNVTGIKYYPVADDVVLSLRGDGGRIWGLGGEDVRINDRYFLGDISLRGFDYGGVGARDKESDDALGGAWYATATAELVFPLGLPKEMGIKGKVFSDVGWIGKPDNYNSQKMVYSSKTRMAVGTGILWQSPMGLINLDFSYPIMKAEHDETRIFRLNFGKGF